MTRPDSSIVHPGPWLLVTFAWSNCCSTSADVGIDQPCPRHLGRRWYGASDCLAGNLFKWTVRQGPPCWYFMISQRPPKAQSLWSSIQRTPHICQCGGGWTQTMLQWLQLKKQIWWVHKLATMMTHYTSLPSYWLSVLSDAYHFPSTPRKNVITCT